MEQQVAASTRPPGRRERNVRFGEFFAFPRL